MVEIVKFNATKKFPDTKRYQRHNNPEVGVHTAQQDASDPEKRVDKGDVRHLSSAYVLDEKEGMVQEQEDGDRRAHSVGTKPPFIEPVRQDVSEETRVPTKG